MTTTIVFALIILACAFTQAPERIKPAWSQHFRGCQKIFALVALILAVLIIINPEFLALGLLGDTAFFDLLVLALSVQMQSLATRLWRSAATVFSRHARWLRVPSPGMLYLMSLSVLAIGSMISTIQKTVQRISS